MKKLIALVLAVLMTAVCAASALAEINFDYLNQGGQNGLIAISVSSDGADAYIETTLPRTNFRFEHPYTHPGYFSATEFDFIILDYATENPMPVMRLWIRYFGTQFMNVEDVSFVIDGVTYRFHAAGGEDRRQLVEGKVYAETPAIIFSAEHIAFLEALTNHASGAASLAELEARPVTMILHGDTDVEVTLGSGFMLDFLGVWSYYANSGCMMYLSGIQGTEMSVEE